MKKIVIYVACVIALCYVIPSSAQIKAIWLTHDTEDPSSIVVNWQSAEPGTSAVYFQEANGPETMVENNGNNILHHVRIPISSYNTTYHYRVKTGKQVSEKYTFKGYPSRGKELRAAVVGNWGYADAPDVSQILKDDPHVLLTLGDNVANLHVLCGEAPTGDCIAPYVELIRSYPELFRSIPFMPILGNHDKEIRPRGKKYPPLASYDTTAAIYRNFFALPGKEWVWKFNIPEHNVSFVALDLNHSKDLGTTWQSNRSYKANAEQFNWYKQVMKKDENFTITLYNDRNDMVRKLEDGKWREVIERGDVAISGYGYFQERADENGFPYFTTSLQAGDQYPDVASKFLKGVGGYVLLKFQGDGSYRIEMKTLEGEVIDVTTGEVER